MRTCVSTLIGREKNAPKPCRLSDTPWQPFIPKVYQSISERNRIFIGAQPESDTVGDRGICFASRIRLKLRRAIIKKKQKKQGNVFGAFFCGGVAATRVSLQTRSLCKARSQKRGADECFPLFCIYKLSGMTAALGSAAPSR